MDCLTTFNHAFFAVVDSNGNEVLDNDPAYEYWSGISGELETCPAYKHQTNSSPYLFWIVVCCLVLLRLGISAIHIRIAVHMLKRRAEERKQSKKVSHILFDRRRSLCFGVPLTTLFESIHTICMSMTAISLGVWDRLNPIDAYILLSFSSGTFVFSLILSCMKLIHLGQRILPKNLRGDKVLSNSIKNDAILLFLFLSMVGCQIVGFVFSLIIGPITRNSNYSANGIALHGISGQMGILIIIRQGERLVNYMIESSSSIKPTYQVEENNSSNNSNRHNPDQIQRVIKLMRVRSLVVFISGTPNTLLMMLCGFNVEPMHWYYPLAFGFGAGVSSIGSTLAFIPPGINLCSCKDKKREKIDDSHVPKKVITSPSSADLLKTGVIVASFPNPLQEEQNPDDDQDASNKKNEN